jgi:UDP-N-acetylglucosamine diphosphorylase / glucose-1-phosphate thymidylyltransferase / UDP-N-acetylgalactosamine diphosphorylase / glucosamine-1-phosphate N-acetyltransferase / galactosamine-1-phosphate N-acetyltransferase
VILLYDDALARSFEPFATTRPLSEMRAGALLIRERWERVFGGPAIGFVSAPHLDGFVEFDAPPFARAPSAVPGGAWVVNTRALPFLDAQIPPDAQVVDVAGRVAAVRLQSAVGDAEFLALMRGESLDAALGVTTEARVTVEGVWLDAVWDLVAHLGVLLMRDIPALASTLEEMQVLHADSHAGVHVVGQHAVSVEAGATIEPLTFFDTSAGPVLLRRGSSVQAFTRVVGPCYVGAGSTIMADRIAGSSIGDVCRVHGELSVTILVGHANKGHDGFVGHSVLGRWVNLGAGTITSNLKNTYGPVALWTPDGVRDSGQQFLGTLFGDHAKTGIGLRLTTGCVLGAGANVYDQMPPKAVPPFSWGGGTPYMVFAAEKFTDTARRMMQRRGVALSPESANWWRTLHAHAVSDARWPPR